MSARRQNRANGSVSYHVLTDSMPSGGVTPAKRRPVPKKQSLMKAKVSKKSKAVKRSRSGGSTKPNTRSARLKKAVTARKALDGQLHAVEKLMPGEPEMSLVNGAEAAGNNPAEELPPVKNMVTAICESPEALALIALPSSAASENGVGIQVSSEPSEQTLVRTVNVRWIALRSVLATGWNWVQQRLKSQQSRKRLRVCESVSLGEKRFVAVIQVDGEQFLVGGSSSSISTLAHLERSREFSDVFRQRYQQDPSQA